MEEQYHLDVYKRQVGKAAKEVGKIIEDTFNLLNPTTTVYTKVDNYSLNAAIGSFKTAFGTILNEMCIRDRNDCW